MKDRLIILVLAVFLVLGFIIGCQYHEMRSGGSGMLPDTIYTTDTIWQHDTFHITKPIPKYIVKVRTDTVYDSNGNEIELTFENKLYQDTIICREDTLEYQIFTSGIKSNLDSLNLTLKKSEKINTIEIIKYIEKDKKFKDRFHIQPQLGLGYGLFNKGFDAYVGLGIGIDL